MRCNGSNWAVYSPGSWDGFRNDVWALWAAVIMCLEHHLVGGYVRNISPHIIIIIIGRRQLTSFSTPCNSFHQKAKLLWLKWSKYSAKSVLTVKILEAVLSVQRPLTNPLCADIDLWHFLVARFQILTWKQITEQWISNSRGLNKIYFKEKPWRKQVF